MKTIKNIGGYSLNYDPLMKLYNISTTDDLSFWFDSYQADALLLLPDNEYIDECKEILKQSNV